MASLPGRPADAARTRSSPAARLTLVSRNPHRLLTSCSVLLDLVRFSAAILVVAAHFTHPEFSTGVREREILGDIAVPVFFVLSGFVIRHVTLSREHTLREFLVDRASRIYSVALPAMALTLAVSALCRMLRPDYYLRYFAAFADHPVSRILMNLSFLSQSWGHSTIPFTDSPFWSLSYECLYYAAYGFCFYLRAGTRVVALLLWAAVAGPQVLFLLPIWWLGCCCYDLYRKLRRTPAANALGCAFLIYLMAAIMEAAVGRTSAAAVPQRLVLAFSLLPNPLIWLHLVPHRATLLALGTGTLASVVLLLLLLLCDFVSFSKQSRFPPAVRFVADGTFAIYLMHYPLMVLAETLHLFRSGHTLRNAAVGGVICVLLVLIAVPLDRLKLEMRAGLGRIGRGRRQLRRPDSPGGEEADPPLREG
jgi:peptidoglycan/LPS O-acetylase OafA/YrhL